MVEGLTDIQMYTITIHAILLCIRLGCSVIGETPSRSGLVSTAIHGSHLQQNSPVIMYTPTAISFNYC